MSGHARRSASEAGDWHHELRRPGADDLQWHAGDQVSLLEADRREHRGRVEHRQKLGFHLRHGDAGRHPAVRHHLDRNDAGADLERDRRRAAREREPSGLDQRVQGRDGRVAGQRNLVGEREIARPDVGPPGRQHEAGLGQVHLARDGEQGGVVEVVGVEHDGAGVAREPGPREGVDLHERVAPRRPTHWGLVE